MNAEILLKLLVHHNRRAVAIAIGLGCCAIFFWLLSYAIATSLTATFFRLLLPRNTADWIQPAIVGGFMLLLVGEMWRKRSGVFNLAEFRDSDFYFGHVPMSPLGMNHPGSHFVAGTYFAWFVSQVLLLAPHTTVSAVRHWRSRVKVDEQAAQRAVELYRILAEAKNWVPIPHRKQKLELAYLDRAGLLWSRREGKLLEVQTFRYEPAVSWWAEFQKFVGARRG